jgi:hypothetical protein
VGKGGVNILYIDYIQQGRFSDFRNICFEGLYFISVASFHIFGKVKRGNLLVVAKWCAGT